LLAKTGARHALEIAETLNLTKQQLYPCLKKLQNQGILYATIERPAKFYALSIEKVLEMLANSKIDEARNLQKNKDQLLAYWQATIEHDKYRTDNHDSPRRR